MIDPKRLADLVTYLQKMAAEYTEEQAKVEADNDWLRGYYQGKAGSAQLAALWLMEVLDDPRAPAYAEVVGVTRP